MHEFSPISRLTLSIFSTRMRLEQASSLPNLPPSTPVLSKDKLLTSVKAFLINRGIRHGMSSGVQSLLIKGGGGPGHTSLLVHLSGQFSTLAPLPGRTHQPTLGSHAPEGGGREDVCSNEGAWGARGRERGRGATPGAQPGHWSSGHQAPEVFSFLSSHGAKHRVLKDE